MIPEAWKKNRVDDVYVDNHGVPFVMSRIAMPTAVLKSSTFPIEQEIIPEAHQAVNGSREGRLDKRMVGGIVLYLCLPAGEGEHFAFWLYHASMKGTAH